MQQFSCELQSPRDPFIWVTIALSASGIPLCSYFLADSWRTWRRMRRPTTAPSSKVTLESPPSQAGVSTGPSQGNLIPHEAHNSDTQPVRTVSDASRAKTMHLSFTGTSPTRRLLEINRNAFSSPIRWIRDLSFNETLHLLLLTSWIIMTVDQFLDTSYVSTVTLICPHYNCRHQALASTPGCPAATLSVTQLYIQPLASCLFVLATMNRFVRVYAYLSRARQLVLQIGSALIIVATGIRWAAIPLLDQLIYLPTGLFDEVVPNQEALLLYNLSFHVVYLVMSLADIVSLLLGLQYVLSIRAELKALRKHHEGGLIVQSTASQLAQGSIALFAVPTNPVSQATSVNSKQSKWVQRQEQSAGVALFWILFNLALLVSYLSVMLIPEVLNSLPIQFVFSLLTLILKLFVTGMTFSISAMTNLVKARNTIQSQ